MKYTLLPLVLMSPIILLIGCLGTRPINLGVHGGKLTPCPLSPNCVSSQAPDKGHSIPPLPFTGSGREALSKLKAIVRSLPRATIISETDAYFHAEFKSLLFRFVDDVEFFADDEARVIHVRSASRLGHSDLGVNRKRIETIRKHWQEMS